MRNYLQNIIIFVTSWKCSLSGSLTGPLSGSLIGPLTGCISPEDYNISHNFVIIIINVMQHQLNGESATNSKGSPSHVLVGMLEQVPPDRIHTAQNSNIIHAVNWRKWSNDDNRIAMECFIRSKPENRWYRRRMISIQQHKNACLK